MGAGLVWHSTEDGRSLALSLHTSFSSCDMQNCNSGWSVFISHKPSQDKWSLFPQVTTAKSKVFFRHISPAALTHGAPKNLIYHKRFAQNTHIVIQMWHI